MTKKEFKIIRNFDHCQKTIRLPVPLAEKLEKYAYMNNISFNCLVQQCIQYAFDNLDEDEKISAEYDKTIDNSTEL